MNSRVELKFLINYEDYIHLRRQLKLIMKVDENQTDEDGYDLSSLYFDDMYDSATYDKADGVEYHRKFRIRTYENGKTQLEFKTKNQNITTKDILPLSKELELALINRDFKIIEENLDKPLIKQLFVKMKLNHLKPALYIDYKREAYVFHNDEIRITFDKDILVYNCYNKNIKYKVLEPRKVILEVKYRKAFPDSIRKVVLNKKHISIPYSKYLMGWLKLTNRGV